jgi:hypothetical protein
VVEHVIVNLLSFSTSAFVEYQLECTGLLASQTTQDFCLGNSICLDKNDMLAHEQDWKLFN